MVASTNITWRLAGEGLVSCNCAWGCPCQFNALPTRGRCEGIGVWQIRDGRHADTPLDGLCIAMLCSWPGAVHEGDGTIQYVIDERATTEQRDALVAIVSGKSGGAFFEIFASVCPHSREPLFAPIDVHVDRERRLGTARIPAVLEARTEPIRNPVTGEEHRARIVLPVGFEYTEAEVANCARLRVQIEPPLQFACEGTHAHLNAFEWSNV